jgi:hypothetical protein
MMTTYAILFLLAYFVPTFIARRGRRGSVFIVNLFLGWTMLGWVLAMYLAMRTNETP